MALLPFGALTSLKKVLHLSGGTMTGSIVMGTNSIIFTSPSGYKYALTIDDSGALVTTQIISHVGESIGMFPLTITYS